MKNVRVFLALLVALALVLSLYFVYERHLAESGNKHVELVVDLASVRELSTRTGRPVGELLAEFRELGVESLSTGEKSVEEAVIGGRIGLFSGIGFMSLALFEEHLRDNLFFGEREDASEFGFGERGMEALVRRARHLSSLEELYFFVIPDEVTYRVMEKNFAAKPGPQSIVIREGPDLLAPPGHISNPHEEDGGGSYLLAVDGDWDDIREVNTGFDPRELQLAEESGMQTILRLRDSPGLGREGIGDLFSELDERLEYSGLIFSGSDVLGYGREPEMAAVASEINNRELSLGVIDLFWQRGLDQMVRAGDYRAVRLHSIPQHELVSLGMSRAVNRFLRAIRERGVRMLYLRPFLHGSGEEDPVALNRVYLTELRESLEAAGFETGTAVPPPTVQRSPLDVFIVGTGIVAAVLLYLSLFLKHPPLLLLLQGLGSGILVPVLLFGGRILGAQAMALIAANTFPVLAVFELMRREVRREEHGLTSLIGGGSLWLLWTAGLALVGALLVSGLMSDINFMLKISQFRGVKLSYVLPLLILGLLYCFPELHLRGLTPRERVRRLLRRVSDLLTAPVTLRWVLAGLALIFMGVVYIQRTGNLPWIPVLQLEVWIRELMEGALVARPRFKEFLIGYPLLMLAAAMKMTGGERSFLFPFILLGAAAGPVTTLNTFSHIHVPVALSMLRTFNGLVLGLILGVLLIAIALGGHRLIVRLLAEDERPRKGERPWV